MKTLLKIKTFLGKIKIKIEIYKNSEEDKINLLYLWIERIKRKKINLWYTSKHNEHITFKGKLKESTSQMPYD